MRRALPSGSCAELIGRKMIQGSSLDCIVHDGVTLTEPVQVRRLLRTHFLEWFVPKPGHCGGIEGDESSWRQMVDPLADFQLVKQSYGHHHIPGGQVDNRLLEVALDPSDAHEFEPDAE